MSNISNNSPVGRRPRNQRERQFSFLLGKKQRRAAPIAIVVFQEKRWSDLSIYRRSGACSNHGKCLRRNHSTKKSPSRFQRDLNSRRHGVRASDSPSV